MDKPKGRRGKDRVGKNKSKGKEGWGRGGEDVGETIKGKKWMGWG